MKRFNISILLFIFILSGCSSLSEEQQQQVDECMNSNDLTFNKLDSSDQKKVCTEAVTTGEQVDLSSYIEENDL